MCKALYKNQFVLLLLLISACLVILIIIVILICVDVNECRSPDYPACSYGCVDEPLSYHCTCDDGYTLGEDQHTCVGKTSFNIGLTLKALDTLSKTSLLTSHGVSQHMHKTTSR